ncbi:MAG: hypothetical protein GX850_05110 [Clostridiaceae bacterium]|nr:hypothetical protein [Clostridiaceae bacterium]
MVVVVAGATVVVVGATVGVVDVDVRTIFAVVLRGGVVAFCVVFTIFWVTVVVFGTLVIVIKVVAPVVISLEDGIVSEIIAIGEVGVVTCSAISVTLFSET